MWQTIRKNIFNVHTWTKNIYIYKYVSAQNGILFMYIFLEIINICVS